MRKLGMFMLVTVLLAASIACGGSGFGLVVGSGEVIEKDVSVSDFDKIDVQGIGSVFVEIGDEETVRIEAQDNLMEYLEVEVRGDTLEIRQRPGVGLRPTRPLNFYVTAKALDSITLSGSADVEVEDNLESKKDFTLRLSGAGDITLADLEAESISLKLSGTGDVTAKKWDASNTEIVVSGAGSVKVEEIAADTLETKLSGTGNVTVSGGEVEKQIVNISGAGDYRAGDMESREAEVRVGGVGGATVDVDEYLNVTISGAGSVRYSGDPRIEKSVSGVGDIEQVER